MITSLNLKHIIQFKNVNINILLFPMPLVTLGCGVQVVVIYNKDSYGTLLSSMANTISDVKYTCHDKFFLEGS